MNLLKRIGSLTVCSNWAVMLLICLLIISVLLLLIFRWLVLTHRWIHTECYDHMISALHGY
uniref:Uncharacterized protein n=1 Tax=Rhizophora mucronata TaxID=61149 RepID=A0A2P2JKY5_RHIMU